MGFNKEAERIPDQGAECLPVQPGAISSSSGRERVPRLLRATGGVLLENDSRSGEFGRHAEIVSSSPAKLS
jgi:hypothetical protein